MTVVYAKVQVRRDTAANWAASNPVLAEGESGFTTDTLVEKIGDGARAWNDLPSRPSLEQLEAAQKAAQDAAETATQRASAANGSAAVALDRQRGAEAAAELAATAAAADTLLFFVGQDETSATFVVASRAVVSEDDTALYPTITVEVANG